MTIYAKLFLQNSNSALSKLLKMEPAGQKKVGWTFEEQLSNHGQSDFRATLVICMQAVQFFVWLNL